MSTLLLSALPIFRSTEVFPSWTGISTFVLAAVSFLFGTERELLAILGTLVLLDYVTGFLAAWVGRRLDSRAGFAGLARKLAVLATLILANQIDLVVGRGPVLYMVTAIILIANEGISITENLVELGVPVPRQVRDVLRQMQQQEGPRDGTTR